MIVVSGCPRSGTSLMMDCLRIGLGEDRIVGHKFPQEERFENFKKKQPLENDNEYAVRMYTFEKVYREKWESDLKKSKDMNPNGFWECRYTVEGVSWHLGIKCKPTDICKIVSNGLFHSDPKYIDKIIFMLRHPREVAKSQERLKGRIPFVENPEDYGLVVHSPEMFINVTVQAARWLKENNNIPILLVKFDDLLMNPDEQFKRIREFLGEGDFSKHPIQKKLYRSKPEEIEHDLWKEAEYIYEKMQEQNYDDIIKFATDNRKKIRKEADEYFCLRSMRYVPYNLCVACKNEESVRNNLKKEAERQKVEWKNEPCVFECAYAQDRELINIDESIKNNFWIKNTEVKKDKLPVDKEFSQIIKNIKDSNNSYMKLYLEQHIKLVEESPSFADDVKLTARNKLIELWKIQKDKIS